MTDMYTWGIVAVVALITAALRFLPFFIFGKERKVPKIIEKLGRVLPYATMAMLVIYCLKDVNFTSVSGIVPPVAASLVVALLYIWKRNTLISIIAGTLSYMLLVQLVF